MREGESIETRAEEAKTTAIVVKKEANIVHVAGKDGYNTLPDS